MMAPALWILYKSGIRQESSEIGVCALQERLAEGFNDTGEGVGGI